MNLEILKRRHEIYCNYGSPEIFNLMEKVGSQHSAGSFDYHVHELKKISRTNNPKEYWEFYFKNIFPTSLKIFQSVAKYQVDAKNSNDKEALLPVIEGDFFSTDQNYDVLISLVGFQPEPVLHSIFTIQPSEIIYLICSEETQRLDNNILFSEFLELLVKSNTLKIYEHEDGIELEALNYKYQKVKIELLTIKSISSIEVINSIRTLIDENIDSKRIAIDITGGKKTMLAGAYTTAAFFSQDAFYVDFEEYDTESGRPIPGTEFLNKLINPIEFHTLKEEETLHEFWLQNNYAACEQVLKVMSDTLNKYSKRYDIFNLKEKNEKVKTILKLALCYRDWDYLAYKAAYNHILNFDDYKSFHTKDGYDPLKNLSEIRSKKILYTNREFVVSWAADRIANGDRFSKNLSQDIGNLEIAYVRYFYAIELLLRAVAIDEKPSQFYEIVNNMSLHKVVKNYLTGYFGDEKEMLGSLKDFNRIKKLRNDITHNTFKADDLKLFIKEVKNLVLKVLKYFMEANCKELPITFPEVLKLHEFAKLNKKEFRLEND